MGSKFRGIHALYCGDSGTEISFEVDSKWIFKDIGSFVEPFDEEVG
jgi:hypothetical protein